MQPRSGLTSMHAEAGPNGPRLQRVAVVDMAVPRVISTSVPLQTSRMKTGSASTQGLDFAADGVQKMAKRKDKLMTYVDGPPDDLFTGNWGGRD